MALLLPIRAQPCTTDLCRSSLAQTGPSQSYMRYQHTSIRFFISLIAIIYLVETQASDVLPSVLPHTQGPLCISGVHDCSSNGANNYRSPNHNLFPPARDLEQGNMSLPGFSSSGDSTEEFVGPQKPRLAVRLYYMIRSEEVLFFGFAVCCIVLLIRVLVVPGRVWERVWKMGGVCSSLMFWGFVMITAAPPFIALCFISGASFMLVGMAMLVLLFR